MLGDDVDQRNACMVSKTRISLYKLRCLGSIDEMLSGHLREESYFSVVLRCFSG